MRKMLLLALAALTMTTTISIAENAPTKMGDSSKGKVLTDEKGMTLYVFDRDSDGKSACNGLCLSKIKCGHIGGAARRE
jgi:predicted lipoprotein with Yx(FWY)xxD motif